mgnify:CR=1 FL=1
MDYTKTFLAIFVFTIIVCSVSQASAMTQPERRVLLQPLGYGFNSHIIQMLEMGRILHDVGYQISVIVSDEQIPIVKQRAKYVVDIYHYKVTIFSFVS